MTEQEPNLNSMKEIKQEDVNTNTSFTMTGWANKDGSGNVKFFEPEKPVKKDDDKKDDKWITIRVTY